jgi:hypothetical protein
LDKGPFFSSLDSNSSLVKEKKTILPYTHLLNNYDQYDNVVLHRLPLFRLQDACSCCTQFNNGAYWRETFSLRMHYTTVHEFLDFHSLAGPKDQCFGYISKREKKQYYHTLICLITMINTTMLSYIVCHSFGFYLSTGWHEEEFWWHPTKCTLVKLPV